MYVDLFQIKILFIYLTCMDLFGSLLGFTVLCVALYTHCTSMKNIRFTKNGIIVANTPINTCQPNTCNRK